jgi:hypothetical protein
MDRFTEEITVDNRVVSVVHDSIPIEQIELDRENPRIKYRLSQSPTRGKRLTEKQLGQILLRLPEVRDLLTDIKNSGGIHERVVLKENSKGRFKAIEGNCRTVCLRELHGKEPKNVRWRNIPARILPKDSNGRVIAKLLTSYHVAGKSRWKAHEKAAYCFHMARQLEMPEEEIAISMHQSKSTIARLLVAYSFFVDNYLKIDNGKYSDKGEGTWSYFEEFFKKKELREELTTNPKFGEDFCRWVGDGRLEKGEEVRFLPVMLKHPEARKAFEQGATLAEVKKMIERDDPEQGSDFFKQLGKMRHDFTSAAHLKEILRLRTDNVARQRLLDTYQAMVDFMRLANVDIPTLED